MKRPLLRTEADFPEASVLIINADDWGIDRDTTDRALECIRRGSVSSVSGMVFMADSERAAGLARQHAVDAGLHLNLTAAFSAPGLPKGLAEHQGRVTTHLRRHRFAQVLFRPGLMRSFEYVVRSQLEEFGRLFGGGPERIDGHHHMHLCANVVLGKLLPHGTLVRRNFSFHPGEKGLANRLYRRLVDGMLSRRHQLVDYFYTLSPVEPAERLERIFALAERFSVEVETHPVNLEEHRFLMGGEIEQLARNLKIASGFAVARRHPGGRS